MFEMGIVERKEGLEKRCEKTRKKLDSVVKLNGRAAEDVANNSMRGDDDSCQGVQVESCIDKEERKQWGKTEEDMEKEAAPL